MKIYVLFLILCLPAFPQGSVMTITRQWQDYEVVYEVDRGISAIESTRKPLLATVPSHFHRVAIITVRRRGAVVGKPFQGVYSEYACPDDDPKVMVSKARSL